MGMLHYWKQPALPWESCDRCDKKASERVCVTVQSHPREDNWSLRCHDHMPKDRDKPWEERNPNEWRRSIDLYIDKFLEPYGLKPPFG